MPILADIHNCSGCLSCVESCTTGALSSIWNEEGHLTYKVDQTKCIECHKCEKNCPIINGYMYGVNNFSLSSPYASWCLDDTIRSRSTSGGVFAALAVGILKQGGVVIGASMQNNYVKHIVIQSVEELPLLQGSKYAQSDTTGVFREVNKFLQEGKKVLFSGLGCQVAGLLNYLPRSADLDNLITLDLICGGVPSRHIINKYIDHNKEISEIVAFRNKTKYEFSVKDREGKIVTIPLAARPFPLCGFYTELTNKYICYDCKYVGAHRKADITIGDLWGDLSYPEQHERGLSVAVAHSDKGLRALRESHLELHEIKWDNFLIHNHRMIYGKNILGQSKTRKQLAQAFAEDSYTELLKKFANYASKSDPIAMIKKIARFVDCKINHRRILKEVAIIINNNK